MKQNKNFPQRARVLLRTHMRTSRAMIAALLWQKDFATGGYRMHSDNNFASPSCATDSERVFAWLPGSDSSCLVALSQADGKELWKRDLGPFRSQHGPGASPIAEGGIVYLQ